MQLDLSLEDFYVGKELAIPIDSSQQVRVVVEPGMAPGQELVARAEIRGQPREIIIRLRETRHSTYQRKNADLLADVKISLAEALLGFERTITLLDGAQVNVTSPPDVVCGHDAVFAVEQLGMPVYGRRALRGRLFLRVKIDMPKSRKDLKRRADVFELRRLLMQMDGKKTGVSTGRSKKKAKEKVAVEAVATGVQERETAASGSGGGGGDSGDCSDGGDYDDDDDALFEATTALRNVKKLQLAELREFGLFGMPEEEEDDEEAFMRSPFTSYFFR